MTKPRIKPHCHQTKEGDRTDLSMTAINKPFEWAITEKYKSNGENSILSLAPSPPPSPPLLCEDFCKFRNKVKYQTTQAYTTGHHDFTFPFKSTASGLGLCRRRNTKLPNERRYIYIYAYRVDTWQNGGMLKGKNNSGKAKNQTASAKRELLAFREFSESADVRT